MSSRAIASIKHVLLVTLVCLLVGPPPALASKCSSIQLFLYNLTSGGITVSWTDSGGSKISQGVGAQSILNIGPECINTSGGSPFDFAISGDGFPDAQYSLNMENCHQENWQAALANYPNFCWSPALFKPDALSYYIYKDNELLCLQGPDRGSDPNANLAVTQAADPQCDLEEPQFSFAFSDPSAVFSWNIALGTYEPTAGQGLSEQPTVPGLSPSGVTPCVGTACVVPNKDNDFNYWPVTIYWTGTQNFTFNTDTNFAANSNPAGDNVPSHLTAYPYDMGDDFYTPPSLTNTPNFPAPCWPTFDENGALIDCSPTPTNAPAYVPNPNAKTGKLSVLGISNAVVRVMVNVVTLWGAF